MYEYIRIYIYMYIHVYIYIIHTYIYIYKYFVCHRHTQADVPPHDDYRAHLVTNFKIPRYKSFSNFT